MLPQTDTQTGLICSDRLKKYQNGRISQEEFEKELVYLALETTGELKHQSLPPVPSDVVDFRKLSREAKKDREEMFWRKNWNARNWLTEKNRRKTENGTNWYWLNFYKDKMNSYGDVLNVKKIENIIDTFPLEEFSDLK